MIPKLWIETLKNHTLLSGTYLSSHYKGSPPGGGGRITRSLSKGVFLATQVNWKRTFHILGRWFCQKLRLNSFHESKETLNGSKLIVSHQSVGRPGIEPRLNESPGRIWVPNQ